MYLRAVHSTFDLPTLYGFIQRSPLGVLTTAIPHPFIQTIQSSHIPWILDIPESYNHETSNADDLDASKVAAAKKPLGVLRGHLSRANPQCKALISAAKAAANLTDDDKSPDGPVTLTEEAYILFTGPVDSYVTPKFYTTTKPATGKVVPTWNYEAVQAYGRITVYPSTVSAEAKDFLRKAIEDLTSQSEQAMGFDGADGRPDEWRVDDAPDAFIAAQMKGIMGFSVEITSLGGKFKMSQERPEGDKMGVIEGFVERGKTDLAKRIQQLGL